MVGTHCFIPTFHGSLTLWVVDWEIDGGVIASVLRRKAEGGTEYDRRGEKTGVHSRHSGQVTSHKTHFRETHTCAQMV